LYGAPVVPFRPSEKDRVATVGAFRREADRAGDAGAVFVFWPSSGTVDFSLLVDARDRSNGREMISLTLPILVRMYGGREWLGARGHLAHNPGVRTMRDAEILYPEDYLLDAADRAAWALRERVDCGMLFVDEDSVHADGFVPQVWFKLCMLSRQRRHAWETLYSSGAYHVYRLNATTGSGKRRMRVWRMLENVRDLYRHYSELPIDADLRSLVVRQRAFSRETLQESRSALSYDERMSRVEARQRVLDDLAAPVLAQHASWKRTHIAPFAGSRVPSGTTCDTPE
jgi:hypothetical protein